MSLVPEAVNRFVRNERHLVLIQFMTVGVFHGRTSYQVLPIRRLPSKVLAFPRFKIYLIRDLRSGLPHPSLPDRNPCAPLYCMKPDSQGLSFIWREQNGSHERRGLLRYRLQRNPHGTSSMIRAARCSGFTAFASAYTAARRHAHAIARRMRPLRS